MKGHATPTATSKKKNTDKNAYLEWATHIRAQGTINNGPVNAKPIVERAKKIKAVQTSKPAIDVPRSHHRYGKSEAESCCKEAMGT